MLKLHRPALEAALAWLEIVLIVKVYVWLDRGWLYLVAARKGQPRPIEGRQRRVARMR